MPDKTATSTVAVEALYAWAVPRFTTVLTHAQRRGSRGGLGGDEALAFPGDFATAWTGVTLTERSAAQQHVLDRCAVLDQPPPAADKTDTLYTSDAPV